MKYVVLMVLIFSNTILGNENYKKGVFLFENTKYKEAYPYFLKAKKENIIDTYRYLALYYLNGIDEIVEIDFHKYKNYLWKASQKGDLLATITILDEYIYFFDVSKLLKGISISFLHSVIISKIDKNSCENNILSNKCFYFTKLLIVGKFVKQNLDLAKRYIDKMRKKSGLKYYELNYLLNDIKIKNDIDKKNSCKYVDNILTQQIKNGYKSLAIPYNIILGKYCKYEINNDVKNIIIKLANNNHIFSQFFLFMGYSVGWYGFKKDQKLSEYYLKKYNDILRGYISKISPYYRE